MKKAIISVILVALIGFNIYQSNAISNLKKKQTEVSAKLALLESINAPVFAEEKEEGEVAEYMGKLQTYVTKLYYAGKNKNNPLVAFYLHETEEVMEKLVDANVVDEGVNVSKLMQTYGETQIESIQKQVKKEGLVNFDNHYTNLLNACNACHIQSGHEFIKIIQPQNNPFVNQDFTAKL